MAIPNMTQRLRRPRPQVEPGAPTVQTPGNAPLVPGVPAGGTGGLTPIGNPGAPPPITPPLTNGPPDPNSFQDQVYAPGNDPRLTGVQTATDVAGNAVLTGDKFSNMVQGNEQRYRRAFGAGQVAGGPRVDATDSGRYLKEQDEAVAGLGGPNRTELAKRALADFDAQDAENRQNRYRSLTQNAAGAGRLGMMDEVRNVLNAERTFNQDRMRYANELARDVSEGDIGDRFRRVDATSGLRRGESDIGSGLRDEQRYEREFGTGVDERNQERAFARERAAADYGGRDASADLSDRYNRYETAGNLEDRVFGEGLSNRDEYRTERGFQAARRDRTLDDRVRQRRLENEEQEAAFRRAQAQAAMGGR